MLFKKIQYRLMGKNQDVISLQQKFHGEMGKNKIRQSLSNNNLLKDNTQAIQFLLENSEIIYKKPKVDIFKQGETSDYALFIIHGEVLVVLDKKIIAVRTASEHVGELSATDPTRKRSASIRVGSRAAILCLIKSNAFTNMLKTFPEMEIEIREEIYNRWDLQSRLPNERKKLLFWRSS